MKMINIAGASEGRIAPFIAEARQESHGQCLIVVPTLNRARRLQTDLSFFNAEEPVYILPPDEDSAIAYEAKSNDSLLERMRVLKAVTSGERCTVIAPVTGAIRKLPPPEIFAENTIELKVGQDLDPAQLRSRLSLLGYERVPMVEARGEFSFRGGIIDIYTPEGDDPYRIELFDTEIDSIRAFDIETQRSVETLESLTIYQCSQLTRDQELFAKASGRIRRAYDRAIKRAHKKMEERKSAGGEESAVSIDLEREMGRRRDQLLEYTDGMINLQYLEKFLGYFYDETAYVWDYMTQPQIMVDDPSRILETIEATVTERMAEITGILETGRGIKEDFAALSDQEDFFRIYRLAAERDLDCTIFTPFVMTIKGGKDTAEGPALTELRQVQTRQMPQYDGHMDQLKADLEGYIARGFDVRIVCSTEDRKKNMLEFIQHEDFNERVLPGRYEAGHVSVENGVITAGMELTDRKQCYIWEGDIFGGSKRSRKRSRSSRGGSPIKSFADVQKGDYVVHESHGIGRFTGIEQLVVQGIKQDFLKVEYAGTDMLYIPVDQLDSLQKYIGGDGITPRLNKLSGTEWKATKARAQAAVSDLAQELIRVASVRRNTGGYAFGEDTVWQKEFEDSFPYTETDDQLRCVSEIKADMEQPYPMDRLLCGDVGFGKTEVAARALFKCVIEGKQAAVLVPTTLLANQHYYTLKERFEKFPIRVEMLSRFRTATQQKQIVRDIAKGDVDLVIGTHRLLSADVKFNDLGLLVIDEEQRFGVRHKEKIKQLRENVDVLTLSATPIPRTLHMSLSGMKDMSTIEEPPEGRYPVQTYVMEEDSFLIREAIEKELARGGQVYILSNRVKSINSVASVIQDLVPQASIAVGHGRMKETELENIIMDFAAGEYDILVSTTIIESGTDIPNVNTMIVLDADRFGLAQLYQLRGRVGRAGRIAYTYLMYHKDKVLTEIAEKRLKAIRDFTEFGSGFKIAMRDLELRGAGNILGREQSGHMLEIGYELYCKLLDDALRRAERVSEGADTEAEAKAGSGPSDPEETTAENTAVDLPMQAIIPGRYIDDEVLKLQMYKKIALIETEEDASDVTDEFIDRFGDPPLQTQNLIRIAVIRAKARRLGVTSISQSGNKLKFTLVPDVRFGPDVVPDLVAEYGERIRFNGGARPFIRLTTAAVTSEAGRAPSADYTQKILKELEQFFRVAGGETHRESK